MGFDPAVHKHSTGVQFYWLCETCAKKVTLTYREGSGVTTKPLVTLRAAS
jgi:hypothetical protein